MRKTLNWEIIYRWGTQTTHQAKAGLGSFYIIKQVKWRQHFPVYFTTAEGERVDIGFDEPLNLKQAKRQCEAHASLGAPVPCSAATLFAEYERLYPRKQTAVA